MAEYRIVAKIDPSGVTAGKAKVQQDLRQIDTAATNTGRNLQRAFNQQALDRSVSKLVNEMKLLRAEITGLAQSNQQIVQSNSRVVSSIDEIAVAGARAAAGLEQVSAGEGRVAAGAASMDAALRRVLQATDQEALELMRLNQIMEDANRLFQQGKITQEQYAAAQALAARGAAQEGATLQQRRAGYQQLGFQIQDITMQAALGINPLTILAQQAGQTASAMQLMTGATRGFWAFMAGPWGSIMVASIAVLGNLAASYFGAARAADDALTASDAHSRAQGALGDMFDLTTGKIRNNTEAVRLNTLALALNMRAQAAADSQAAYRTLRNAGSYSWSNWGSRLAEGPGGLVRQALGAEDTAGMRAATQSARVRNILRQTFQPSTVPARYRLTREQAMQQLANTDTSELSTSGIDLANMISQQVNAEAANDTANRIIQSLSGGLDSSFRREGRGGGKGRGGGARQNPVADFFQRLEQQRDAANVEPSLDRRILETNQQAEQAFNRAPTDAERERIDLLVREIDAREIMQRLTDEYTRPLERERALLGQVGIQRQINNAIMEEEAQLHRRLSPEQKAVIENSIRQRAAMAAQQQVFEEIEGPVDEYRVRLAALNDLLAQGKINQQQFNDAVRDIPLVRTLGEIDRSLTGTMTRYNSQLEQITATIDDAIAVIDRAERAGLIDPLEAARRRSEVGGTSDDNITVTGGSTRQMSMRDRMMRDLKRERENPLMELDAQLGGEFARQAEMDRIMREQQDRIQIITDARAQELIVEEEFQARLLQIRRETDLRLAELDAERFRIAFGGAKDMFESLTSVARDYAGENSRIYRAMFIASKAFAIAEAIVQIQVGVSKALALPFPANIPAIASVVALGAGILANIRAASMQFEQGGFTGDGDRKEVAGIVHKREFVVNADGTRRNRALLEAINAGAVFGSGKPAAPSSQAMRGGGGNTLSIGTISVKVEGRSDDPEKTGREVEAGVLRAVSKLTRAEILDQRRDGGILSDATMSA